MKKKILILVNNLGYLKLLHRLHIIKAAKADGFEVIVVYGQLGNGSIKKISNIGIICIQTYLISGSTNPFMELISIYSIFYLKKLNQILFT